MPPEAKSNIAWQYHGYPALSKWMASSNDFFLLRRFSPLQVRCLLYLQNQIAVKSKQLDEWDTFAMCQEPEKGNSGWIDEDPETLPGNPRPRILREILPLLKDYSKSPRPCRVTLRIPSRLMTHADDLVASFSKLKAMQTATPRQTGNIDNWFESYGQDAIDPEEQHYKGHQGDLVTMISKPQYPLIALLHSSRIIRRMFKLKLRSDRIASQSTTYTSTRGLEVLAAMLSLTVGLSMTFASIWWLNFVDDKVFRLAIITASGTLMCLITWAAAGNRPFEILAAFAAYMAVLMIYQQIS
jgi:hypothetical protein